MPTLRTRRRVRGGRLPSQRAPPHGGITLKLLTTLLAAGLLAGALAVTLAPAASAIAPCTFLKDSYCPALFCKHYNRETHQRDTCVGERIYCITEPCGPYLLP